MVKIKKQKIRFRKKKTDASQKPARRIGFKSFFKFLIAVLLVGSVGFAFVSVKYMFTEIGYFVVKNVNVRLSDNGAIRNLSFTDTGENAVIGANIFFIDLNKFKDEIEKSHTEFKDIVVRRLLPNKLIVEAELRRAIAQISSDRYYFVDREGVLLPNVKNFPEPGTPIITGIGINLAKIKPYNFSRFEKDKIDKALEIIIEMENIEELSQIKLKSVDIADPGNISFFMEDASVEIKIGNEDFPKRLKVLATLIEQVGADINNFKYIDLRFEDPIIGPR